MAPISMAIVVPLFVVSAALSRYVSLASLPAAVVTPALLIALGHGRATVAASVMIGALIVLRHRDNIRRIRHGTEARIGFGRPSRIDSGVA